MLRTLAGDQERFEKTYFEHFKGYYFTGDGCRRDKDGYYWLTGKSAPNHSLPIDGCHCLRPAWASRKNSSRELDVFGSKVQHPVQHLHPSPNPNECFPVTLVPGHGIKLRSDTMAKKPG